MTFGSDINGFIGSLDKVGLTGVGMSVLANGTIPELAFVAFQCMFAVITPALITGAFAERMKFHAFTVFILLWAIFIYNPMAHWVWGGGFLAQLGALDFAGGWLFISCPAFRVLRFAFFSATPGLRPHPHAAP